jgi:uridine phosphorylase
VDKVLHLRAGSNDIGSYVFLCGDPTRVAAISKYFDEQREVSTARGYVIHSGKLSGVRVSVVGSGIGGPSTAIAVEELIALGARTFLRVGTCGSLQEHVKIGDTVISTAAVREEGTTRQYIPLEYPAVASWDVVQSLVQSCQFMKAILLRIAGLYRGPRRDGATMGRLDAGKRAVYGNGSVNDLCHCLDAEMQGRRDSACGWFDD